MKSLRIIFVFTLISIFLSACNTLHIEKRRYMKGYYVSSSWKRSSSAETKTISATQAFIKQRSNDSIPGLSLKPVNSSVANSVSSKVKPASVKHPTQSSNKDQYYRGKNVWTKNNLSKHTVLKSGKIDTAERNGNYAIVASIAFFSMVFAFFMKRKRDLTLRVSKWAGRRKTQTKFLIAGLHLVLGVMGHYIGSYLGDFQIFISDLTRNLIVAGFLSAMVFYPKQVFGYRIYDAKNYLKRKVMDFVLVLMGFLLTVCHGNDLAKPTQQQSQSQFSCSQSMNSVDSPIDQSVKTSSAITENGALALRICLSILTGLLVIELQIVIVILACELSCAGQEGASAVLLTGGTILLALLAVMVFIGIMKIQAPENAASGSAPN